MKKLGYSLLIYAKFGAYMVSYPFWLLLQKTQSLPDSYKLYKFGSVQFVAEKQVVEMFKESLEILQEVDEKVYEGFRELDIYLIHSDQMPRDYFCRRFGITSDIIDSGIDALVSELARIYFVVEFNDYKVSSFYNEDVAPSSWKYAAWANDLRESLE